MARVEWTRQSGEDVEAVVAMLLCTEYPNAWRIRPGRGDGGVDVFVPLSDDRALRDVYQVKKFASNLTSSQKRKIRASFDELLKSAEAEQWERILKRVEAATTIRGDPDKRATAGGGKAAPQSHLFDGMIGKLGVVSRQRRDGKVTGLGNQVVDDYVGGQIPQWQVTRPAALGM